MATITSIRKKLKISDDDTLDAITTNKHSDEKDLEAFLFGNADDEIWEQAGHELSDHESDEEKNESDDKAEEEEVKNKLPLNTFFVELLYLINFFFASCKS